ncbi:hypothetical protein FDG2_2491 [Candidatus Protofrankia californiensis]|uniref:Tellurite resistance methyltransferase TehB-like domain-containing protein n=1 Tax=Candidatus Protofrankia californiensis TaxID=1839754 RepID=A0A1C3NXQ4_9ACTN|nr:hypothetical protein FDG2_2491 [Candidatus Protofrankia californiensis]
MATDLRYRNAGNKILLDLIRRESGRALDCGCGAGDNARLLTGRGWSVIEVTNDPAELNGGGGTLRSRVPARPDRRSPLRR